MSNDNFFEIVKENELVETTILIKKMNVRPISGANIIKSSSEGITVKVVDGAVLRIEEYFFIWIADKKNLEIQC